MSFKRLIDDFKSITKGSLSRKGYLALKPILIRNFQTFLDSRKTSNAGRKRKFPLDVFFEAFYQMVDNATKFENLYICFPSIAGSFKRYLKHLSYSKILNQLNCELLATKPVRSPNIIDSFVVKSCDGSESTGPNYLDRGRKGVKVTLIADLNQVIENFGIFPANIGEGECCKRLLTKKPFEKQITLLADAGYVGKNLADFCSKQRVRLVANPRQTVPKKGYPADFKCVGCQKRNKCNNGVTCVNSKNYRDPSKGPKMTHTISKRDALMLEKERSKIEWTNGRIRRYRGVNVKYVKKISTFETMVCFAVLCNNFIRLAE